MSSVEPYQEGQVCIFTNRGSSGVTSNDGKRCKITLVKPPELWIDDEPGYGIEFLDEDRAFGARHSELEPV